MVYGPIAAFLVELFPARIRYTSMSLPYHIGNGWFGGMLPLLATAMVAASGNIYYGLWYPIVVAAMTVRRRHHAAEGDQGPQGTRRSVAGLCQDKARASGLYFCCVDPWLAGSSDEVDSRVACEFAA